MKPLVALPAMQKEKDPANQRQRMTGIPNMLFVHQSLAHPKTHRARTSSQSKSLLCCSPRKFRVMELLAVIIKCG
jgi:hypothetical protein